MKCGHENKKDYNLVGQSFLCSVHIRVNIWIGLSTSIKLRHQIMSIQYLTIGALEYVVVRNSIDTWRLLITMGTPLVT